MWHIAEGDLHAYLDGALPSYAEGEAERIRRHLDACAECRERLRQAEHARARAASILERAGPGAIEAPPFEAVRRRAAAAGGGFSRPSSVRYRRLAWAASVVVALGAGWMGGRVATSVPEPSSSATRAADESGDIGTAGSPRVVTGSPAGGAALTPTDTPPAPERLARARDASEQPAAGSVAGPASSAAPPGAPARISAAEAEREVAAAAAPSLRAEPRMEREPEGTRLRSGAEALARPGPFRLERRRSDAERLDSVRMETEVDVVPLQVASKATSEDAVELDSDAPVRRPDPLDVCREVPACSAVLDRRTGAERTGSDERALELAALRVGVVLAGPSWGSDEPWVACVDDPEAVTALREVYPAVVPAGECDYLERIPMGLAPLRPMLRHVPTGRDARKIRIQVERTSERTAELWVAYDADSLRGAGYACTMTRLEEGWVAESCTGRWIS